MKTERKIESYLRMAGRAAAMANAASDTWLKTQWQEIARAYKDVAQEHISATASEPGGVGVLYPVERGAGDG